MSVSTNVRVIGFDRQFAFRTEVASSNAIVSTAKARYVVGACIINDARGSASVSQPVEMLGRRVVQLQQQASSSSSSSSAFSVAGML